jgi:hypothetical protein
MNLTRVIRSGLLMLAGITLFAAGGLWLSPGRAAAETMPTQLQVPTEPDGNAACLACHSKDEHMVRNEQEISVQVDPAAYNQSVHGIISCVRCHAEAGPEHAKDPTKPLNLPTGRALKVLKSEGCVKCHAGLYEESYQASFHGIAVINGDDRAATCVDCHGVHDILPSRNQDSRVAPANVAKTCSTSDCHKDAPANFAEGKEHFVAAKKAAGGLNVVYKFFMGLILFDTMKDGPIVMFELLRRLRG